MPTFSERQDTVQAVPGKPNPNTAVCGSVTLALLGLGRFVKWQEHFMSQRTVFRDMLGHVQPTVRQGLLPLWPLLRTDLGTAKGQSERVKEPARGPTEPWIPEIFPAPLF